MSAEVLDKGCETGNLEDVKRAIASGVDPKLPLDHQLSETPLHIACRYVIAPEYGVQPAGYYALLA